MTEKHPKQGGGGVQKENGPEKQCKFHVAKKLIMHGFNTLSKGFCFTFILYDSNFGKKVKHLK